MRSMISIRRSGARTISLLLVASLAWGCEKEEHVGASKAAEPPDTTLGIYVRVLNPTPVDIDSVAIDYEDSMGRIRHEVTLQLDDASQESNFARVDSLDPGLLRIYSRGRMVGVGGGVPIDTPRGPALPPGRYTYRVRLTVDDRQDSLYTVLRDN